jgi:arylsulfatase A-like enzyme
VLDSLYKDKSEVMIVFFLRILISILSFLTVAGEKKPNIVLILADDVGTGDLPVYWNSSVVDMPNIDRLAQMGVRFADAHSTPLCAPSRYMVLSGNYAHRGHDPNGSWDLWANRNQFLDHQKSIAEVLRDAGYHTSMFGKWHLGAKAPPYGTTQDQTFKNVLSDPHYNWEQKIIQGPGDIGFDSSYMSLSGIQDPPYSFYRDGYLTTKAEDIKYWPVGRYSMPHGKSIIGSKRDGEGSKDWDSTAFNMILVNETIKFIDDHMADTTTKSKPFFTYVALGAVHIPHSPPDNYLDGTPIKGVYETRHLNMLLEMDKVVGSLVSMIEDRDLQKDTIFIFASDNGGLKKEDDVKLGHLTSGPLRGKKGNIFEGGHRVPLIMRYDGVFPQNQKRSKVVGLNDLYATLCELADIDVPYGSAQDSVSFAAYAKKNSKTNRAKARNRLAMWTYVLGAQRVREQAIRHNKLKLVRFENSTYSLYHLSDLSETVSVIDNPKWNKKVLRMKKGLEKLGPCPTSQTDKKGEFYISSLNQNKGCVWFREDKSRCQEHFEGEMYCGSICTRFEAWCQ